MRRRKIMVFVIVAITMAIVATFLFYWYELNFALCKHYTVTVEGKPDLAGQVFLMKKDVLCITIVNANNSVVECYLFNPKKGSLDVGAIRKYISFGYLAIIGAQHNLENGEVMAALDADVKMSDSKIAIYLKGAGEYLKINDSDAERLIKNRVAYHRNMILDKKYDK